MLVQLAARHGCNLAIGRMEGGPFDSIHLYDVRCRQRGLPGTPASVGTDLSVAHAELTLAWRIPGFSSPESSAVRRLVLDGVHGRWDLATAPGLAEGPTTQGTKSGRWLDRVPALLVPTGFYVRGDDVILQRNRYRLRVHDLRWSGQRGAAGSLLVRELEISGPGFENTLLNRHAQTLWQGNRLSFSEMELGPGVLLLNATLDGKRLQRDRLDWECTLTALGGEVRGQGAVNFVHPRLALEVAGSLRRMPVTPLARLLGLNGPAGGVVEQGNFSFRGDPEDWPSAQMWLAARATDFRWGQRDWQSLELRATVLHRRIQIHQLELQQRRNRVSLTGECPLLSPGQETGRWWEAGFACNVDARLDDLHALAQLFGNRLPELDGRMSVNGTLEAVPDRPGINGYLNVEGSRLNLRGVPLDYLRSTLLFRGDVLSVADVQATHGEDYMSGRGTASLTGSANYQGEFHLAVADPGVYVPAVSGIIDLEKIGWPGNDLAGSLRLEGMFYGPDLEGKAVLFTLGGFQPPLVLPGPINGDWWGNHWFGFTVLPANVLR